MKIAVHNIKGKETKKKVDLSKDVFGIRREAFAYACKSKELRSADGRNQTEFFFRWGHLRAKVCMKG